MADEWKLLEAHGTRTRQFTVADATAIAKGSAFVLSSDPRTAILHSGADEIWMGCAVSEKEASDGQLEMGLRTGGIWDVKADNAVTLGRMVRLSGTANQVDDTTSLLSAELLGQNVGIALETGSADEIIQILAVTR